MILAFDQLLVAKFLDRCGNGFPRRSDQAGEIIMGKLQVDHQSIRFRYTKLICKENLWGQVRVSDIYSSQLACYQPVPAAY